MPEATDRISLELYWSQDGGTWVLDPKMSLEAAQRPEPIDYTRGSRRPTR
jgi:hypothetical protein